MKKRKKRKKLKKKKKKKTFYFVLQIGFRIRFRFFKRKKIEILLQKIEILDFFLAIFKNCFLFFKLS